MRLEKVYFNKVKELNLQSDNLQIKAIQNLQNIINQLDSKKIPKYRFFNSSIYPKIKGRYMWGGVGRGKTFIMDIFYKEILTEKKKRQHFVHFMQDIHRRLRCFQGKKNPVAKVALEIAKETQIICFDEFFVEDIADALILGNVFRELFNLGVVLVATSNIAPEKLYFGGLQRKLFLPVIDMLLENTAISNLDSGIDYRFRLGISYNNYLFPYNEKNRINFFDRFFIRNKNFNKDYNIKILGRNMLVLFHSNYDICFDFSVICGDGRSVYDYIDICKNYEQIYIYNLECFDACNEDAARRFIALIDECYDQNKKVIILANEDFNNIYRGVKLSFEFQRTISRLYDMQNFSFAH